MNAAGISLKVVDDSIAWIGQDRTGVSEAEEMKVDDSSQLNALKSQNRDLLAIVATLQNENTQLKQVPEFKPQPSTRSFQSTYAVETRVIGEQSDDQKQEHRLLISLGKRNGLAGDELILAGQGILVDQGELAELTTDQLVTFGRSLFGRTVQVGKWTSLVQPTTDPEFRTAVQLLRNSELGLVVGTKGILKGTGTACEVIEIPGTEAVAVGDLVYTDTHVSATGVPIYCGQVIEATIAPGATHWSVLISPPASLQSVPARLTVLRVKLADEVRSEFFEE